MSPRVCVLGLWHLGCVTAACLAEAGHSVVGLDFDERVINDLQRGTPPIAEPGLDQLIGANLDAGRLAFTSDAQQALATSDVLWVTFDTPVDDDDQPDLHWVAQQIARVRPFVTPGTLVIVSSQMPVGFTAELEEAWQATEPTLTFACIPENLRLGRALEAFRKPQRWVVGLGKGTEADRIARLLEGFGEHIEWMSLPSAEMTKHALNTYLAVCVTFANEVARICERTGADAQEVERGIRTDPRVGQRAYVTAGAAFAGGTLARDVSVLTGRAEREAIATPVLNAILPSNAVHQAWVRERLEEVLNGIEGPQVALLGLTYTPGTNTLRRSSSITLARALMDAGVKVRAYDPAITAPSHETAGITIAPSIADALSEADAAVVATPIEQLRALHASDLLRRMRHVNVIDPAGTVSHLADDPRITYRRVGLPQGRR